MLFYGESYPSFGLRKFLILMIVSRPFCLNHLTGLFFHRDEPSIFGVNFYLKSGSIFQLKLRLLVWDQRRLGWRLRMDLMLIFSLRNREQKSFWRNLSTCLVIPIISPQ